MALSATPAPRTRARAPRSMFSDRRTGSNLVAAFVLARLSLLVLSGKASVSIPCVGHDQDPDHRCTAGRHLGVVLAGSTVVDTGGRGVLVMCQHDDPATVEPGRPPGLPASPSALPQEEYRAVRGAIGSLATRLRGEEGRLLGVRPAVSPSALQTTSTALVVAGLIGLLGVAGTAAFVVQSIPRPVRHAVRRLQTPAEGRRDQRRRLATRDGLRDMPPALDTAGDGLLGGVTATAGTLSSGADEQTVAPRVREIGPDVVAEPRSVVSVIAEVVRQAQLAFDAANEGDRAVGADTGSTLVATGPEEPASEAAKADRPTTVTSAPTAGSVATTRYAAARGRAHGPTTALWHAVQLGRLVGPIEGACETTVCGSLVRLSTEETWPVAARDVCPACASLAH